MLIIVAKEDGKLLPFVFALKGSIALRIILLGFLE